MKKKMRRIVMCALAAIIAASAPVAAFAAKEEPVADIVPISAPMQGPQEGGFEAALIAVKDLIDIDDDVFTEFNYSSSFSNYEKREGLIWQFNWSAQSDMKYSYIYASAMEDGTLINFYKFTGETKDFGLASVSKNAAISIANDFIKKANPDTYTYYKSPSDVHVYISNREYTLVYYAQVNGYPFTAAQVNVRVNKFTGEVTGYDTSNYQPGLFKFDDASGIISQSDAVEAYAEKIGLSLEYVSFSNYETGELKVFPVYKFDAAFNKFINAVTGDVAEYVYDRGNTAGYDSFDGAAPSAAPMAESVNDSSSGSSSSRASLTPAEITAIDRVSSFISPEQALQKLLDTAGLGDIDLSDFNEQYISLNRDYIDRSRYCYNISIYRFGMPETKDGYNFYGINGRVEAETGRVLNFDVNYDYSVQDASAASNYTVDQMKQEVNAFLKKEAPAELAKSKLEQTYEPGVEPYRYRGNYYTEQYVRYENDIPFKNNSVSATFDPFSGKVVAYSLYWYEDIKFPAVSGILPAKDALSAFVEQNGSKLFYTTVGESKAALVYQFNYRDYIDPFTGKAINYDGEPWIESEVSPDYDDIKGHWCEEVVTMLLDNGVAMWSGSFEPERTMTQYEFLEFLLLIEPYYYYGISPASYFVSRNVDIDADDEKILTRQEAVRIITQYLGYGKLAEQPEWFVYPFGDVVDDSYKGYVTICYMLGIISGNGSGGFGASDNITRAQAATMLYKLILAKD